MGFLLFTIAGERLELARLQQLSKVTRVVFVFALGFLLVGVVGTAAARSTGIHVAGIGMIGLTLWLMGHDIARRTVRRQGLTRFIAICLLSGYLWLAISGVLALFSDGEAAGPYYDAMVHAFFLGFVFSMIFGHAPMIFPAILGAVVTFRPTFYAHLILLTSPSSCV